jgi:hypothetical protein
LFCEQCCAGSFQSHLISMPLGGIVHAYPPIRRKPKATPAPSKPAVIVTARAVKQVEKDRRIQLARERGF